MARSAQLTTAVILAGGLGTRLRTALPDKPKGLAPVGNRPFVLHLLDQLAPAAIKRVIFCTGYLAEQYPRALGRRYRGMSLRYSRESHPLGTGGALGLAASALGSADPVLVLNGDSYFDVPIREFGAWHAERNARASVALGFVSNVSRFGAAS